MQRLTFLATGQNVATECAGIEASGSSYWDCFGRKTWAVDSLIASEILKWFLSASTAWPGLPYPHEYLLAC